MKQVFLIALTLLALASFASAAYIPVDGRLTATTADGCCCDNCNDCCGDVCDCACTCEAKCSADNCGDCCEDGCECCCSGSAGSCC